MIGKKRGLFGARREPPPMPPIELPKPTFKTDFVGPTVDDDMRRIIARYGLEEVKAAMARRTKAKRGRKPEKDWQELAPILKEDALRWLDGGDPFKERTNYKIAKEFAIARPGQSAISTHERLMKKLAKARIRYTMFTAWELSEKDYPYTLYLKALEAVVELAEHDVYAKILKRAHERVAEYQSKFGSIPEDMSMSQVETESYKPSPALSGSRALEAQMLAISGVTKPF